MQCCADEQQHQGALPDGQWPHPEAQLNYLDSSGLNSSLGATLGSKVKTLQLVFVACAASRGLDRTPEQARRDGYHFIAMHALALTSDA